MKTNVYIVKCESYEEAGEKLEVLLGLMGGMGRFAKPGEKITLKANLLTAAAPEKAVSTHPAIVAAVGAMTKKEGAIPLIADAPGSGSRYTEAALKKLYETCGMDSAAKQAGIDLNMDTGSEKVSFPQGLQMKRMEVITAVTRADGVFNLCKMKTHMLMHMTGAVKNNFGVIPGLSKMMLHGKLFKKERFADMLLDLALYVSPRLSIMDAVMAMEGEGPGVSGTPRHVGLLLASESPLAIDVVAGEIMGLPHEQNPILLAAERRGLTPHGMEGVNVVGEDLASLVISDYKFPATVKIPGATARDSAGGNNAVADNATRSDTTADNIPGQPAGLFPVVSVERCIGCGICVEACPQKTINFVTKQDGKRAVVDPKNCIRCYCCHELCPHAAIDIV